MVNHKCFSLVKLLGLHRYQNGYNCVIWANKHGWMDRSRGRFQPERLGTAFPKLFWQWERHLNQL